MQQNPFRQCSDRGESIPCHLDMVVVVFGLIGHLRVRCQKKISCHHHLTYWSDVYCVAKGSSSVVTMAFIMVGNPTANDEHDYS